MFRNVYYRRFGSATTFWDFFCFTAFGLTGMRSWGDGFTAYHTTAQMLLGGRKGKEDTLIFGLSCRCGIFIRMGCWNLEGSLAFDAL